MPSRNELIVMFAGLNMQAFISRDLTTGAAFRDCADRAHRSAVTLADHLISNVPGLTRDGAQEDAELLRKAYEGVRNPAPEGEDASLEHRAPYARHATRTEGAAVAPFEAPALADIVASAKTDKKAGA